jgi:hypothetical protein
LAEAEYKTGGKLTGKSILKKMVRDAFETTPAALIAVVILTFRKERDTNQPLQHQALLNIQPTSTHMSHNPISYQIRRGGYGG